MTRIMICAVCASLVLTSGCAASGAAVSLPNDGQITESEPVPVSSGALAAGDNPAPARPLSESERLALRADGILASMTLEEKLGQMFLAHYPGENAVSMQEKNQFGGYLFFENAFQSFSKDAISELLKSIQAASKIMPLIGVDEEGGGINRVSSSSNYRDAPFKSPQRLYAGGGFEAVAADAAEKADFLKSIGINFNLAPVCDVSTNPADYIYYRTLGQNAELTSEYAATVVTVMNQKKIASALKHFPGYGGNRDTHTGPAYDSRSLESLKNNDLAPFIAGIKAGADCVLVSHNIVTAIDEKNPASLSPAVHRLLRDEIMFDGVIITDDLIMGAISGFTKGASPAVAAILAGNDLLCSGDAELQIKTVAAAVNSGEIKESQIDASVLRILKWKLKMEII